MIGQEKLLHQIDRLVKGGFPRFSILVGPKGSGRHLVAREIAKALGARLVVSGIKADDVRDIIPLAYKQSEDTLYLLPDADGMSGAAKNSLLKITEDPPRNAYFLMTMQDEAQTLATLRSRGTILKIMPYLPSELLQYAEHKGYFLSKEEAEIITETCLVPGDIDLMVRYQVSEFYAFVEKVFYNLAVVNEANAFKAATNISFKDDDGKYDPKLFLRTYIAVCRKALMEEGMAGFYAKLIDSTTRALNDLGISGVNKPATFDMWIMEQRELMKEAGW